jgi:hypothetical protein
LDNVCFFHKPSFYAQYSFLRRKLIECDKRLRHVFQTFSCILYMEEHTGFPYGKEKEI